MLIYLLLLQLYKTNFYKKCIDTFRKEKKLRVWLQKKVLANCKKISSLKISIEITSFLVLMRTSSELTKGLKSQ